MSSHEVAVKQAVLPISPIRGRSSLQANISELRRLEDLRQQRRSGVPTQPARPTAPAAPAAPARPVAPAISVSEDAPKWFVAFGNAMIQRFDAMDQRFDAMDQRFDAMEQHMNQRFDAMDQRFDSIDQTIDIIIPTLKSVAIHAEIERAQEYNRRNLLGQLQVVPNSEGKLPSEVGLPQFTTVTELLQKDFKRGELNELLDFYGFEEGKDYLQKGSLFQRKCLLASAIGVPLKHLAPQMLQFQ